MAVVDFLCLANSRKHGGRCLAGIDLATGRWLRPVSSRSTTGALSLMQSVVDGEVIEVFDRVNLEIEEVPTSPAQPENVRFVGFVGSAKRQGPNGSWEYAHILEELKGVSPRFTSVIEGSRSDRISASSVSHPSRLGSLDLVDAEKVTFYKKGDGSWRCNFVARETSLNLSVTDDRQGAEQSIIRHTGAWTFVLSLGEPFRGFHYKLIATCIPTLT